MSRMLGLTATKWATYMPFRKAKNSARRQGRAIDARERMAEIEADYPYAGPNANVDHWSEGDLMEAEAAYASHPDFSEGGRCSVCYTDQVDAFVYTVRCDPTREPIVHTSESRSSEDRVGPFIVSPGSYHVSPEFEKAVGKKNLERINRAGRTKP